MSAVQPIPARSRAQGLRTPLFLLGVAMALLSFIAMFAVGVLFANKSSPGRLVPVVAAARDIQPRELIAPAMLTVVEQPANLLPPRAVLRAADVKGYSALVPIYKGQVLTDNLVAASPDQIDESNAAYLPIPQGFVAMTLPTSELQGVAGYVAPGDYINVIVTINTQIFNQNPARTVTRTVFTSLHVIRVGPPSAAPREGLPQGLASSLTVVLSECDAQYLDWLGQNATMKYVLLSYKDYTPTAAQPDAACPSTTAPGLVGPAQVDQRWAFTKS